MATILAGYYLDELHDWKKAINFYNVEMHEFEQKLIEVIRRNSIVDIANKVEAHQSQLNNIAAGFYQLRLAIDKQVSALKTDSTLVDDSLINLKMEKIQNQIRHSMQEVEKKYIDAKFNCYHFLSGILKK